MKKGLSIWCFPAGTAIPVALQKASEYGFQGVEPALGPNEQVNVSMKETTFRSLRRRADSLGIEIPSIVSENGWAWPLLTRDKKVYAEAKRLTEESLRVAKILGAKTILLVPGAISADMPYDEAYDRCRDALCDLAPAAESYQVNVGLEIVWNLFLYSPLEMARLIDEVNSPYVGAFFDAGNVANFAYPEQWVRILGSRIKHVHVKDFKSEIGNINGFCNLLEGTISWPPIIKALEEVGYDGHLTAEVGPPHPDHPDFLLYTTSRALDLIMEGAP